MFIVMQTRIAKAANDGLVAVVGQRGESQRNFN